MPDDKDAQNAEVIVITGDKAPALTKFTPAHFNFLDNLFDQYHAYRYRHIPSVSWRQLGFWCAAVIVLVLYTSAYVANYSASDVVVNTLLYGLMLALAIGVLCVFSRCFTRLYHLRVTSLRMLQLAVGLSIFELALPYLLYMNNYISGFEEFLFWSRYLVIIVLCYFLIRAFVSFQWLKFSSIAYFSITLLVFGLLHFYAPVRHYIFKDNELMIYSDFGRHKSRDLKSIDSLIDEIAAELD